jgi:hypothetical protein
MERQSQQTQGLTRLQQNMLALAQERQAAAYIEIATTDSLTTAMSSQLQAQAAAAAEYNSSAAAAERYEAAQAAATARAAAFAQSQVSIVEATKGLNIAEQETAAILQALGVNATEAASRVESGFAGANQTIGLTSGAFNLLSEAAAGGYKNIDEMLQAIGLLSEAELTALNNGTGLAAALERVAAAARSGQSVFAAEAEAIAVDTGATKDIIAAKDAVSAATARYNDILAAEKAEIDELIVSLGGYKGLLAEVTAANDVAAAASTRGASAVGSLAKSAKEVPTGFAAISSAAKKVGDDVGAMNLVFAGFLTTTALIGASDSYAKLTSGLSTVTSGTAQLKAVYDTLLATSNATQTSFEKNANTFVQFADATKGTGISVTDLVKAVGGLDTALKLGNVSGQDAQRVMRSIAEILETTNGSATRFFQNLKRESAPTFALISDSAKRLNIDLKEFGGETDDVGGKIDKLRDHASAIQDKLNGVNTNVSSLTSSFTKSSSEASKYATEIQSLSAKIDPVTGATSKQTAELSKLRGEYNNAQLETKKFGDQLNYAKTQQDNTLQSDLKATQAKIQVASSTADATQKQKDFIAILIDVYTHNSDLVQSYSTVGGALQVLKNNLVDFAGTSKTSSIAMNLVKDAIYLIANNLNTVIPLVFAFTAAVAVVKLGNLISDLKALAIAFTTVEASQVLLAAEFIAGAAIVVALAVAFAQLSNVVLGTHFDPLTATMDVFNKVGGVLGDTVAAISTKLQKQALDVKATTDAQNLLNGSTSAATENGKNLVAVVDRTSESFDVVVARNRAAREELERHNAALAAAKQASDAEVAALAAQGSAWDRFASSVSNAVSKLYDYAKAAAQAAASAVGLGGSSSSTPAVAGASRDGGVWAARTGGTFAIAGGSGVDSKTIKVSPGEIVTVQTPAQYRAGVAPQKRGGQTHFADGGVMAARGTDLNGGAVNLGTGTPSVQGFSESRQGPQGQSVQTSSIGPALSADTAATSANTAAVTANTTAQDTTNLNGAIDNLTSAVSTMIAALDHLGENVTALEGRIASTNFGGGAAGTSASAPANDNTPAPATSASAPAPAPQPAQQAQQQATSSAPTLTGAAAIVAAMAQQPVGITGASVVRLGSNTSTASSGSSSIGSAAQTNADVKKQLTTAAAEAAASLGTFTQQGNGYINMATGETMTLQAYAQKKQAVDALQLQSQLFARDGADFVMPGGSGVDSKLVKLAVSPGESIAVRTPAQRAAAGKQGDGSVQHLTLNITTPDANSFRQSNDQVASKLLRGLNRAGRR